MAALKQMGYNALHFGHDFANGGKCNAVFQENLQSSAHPLAGLEEYDAFLDWPLQLGYKEILNNASKANMPKTILLYRNPADVALSFGRMAIANNKERLSQGGEHKWKNWSFSAKMDMAESLYTNVFNFFVERPFLPFLVMDVIKGDGWQKLCDFLEEDFVPPSPEFPHEFKLS